MAVPPHFVNAATDAASDSLDGLMLTRPDLARLPSARNVVVRRALPAGVRIVCGGGSGHEPAHAAFVGDGWLSAAVCGAVFASPSHASVLEGLRHLAKDAGAAGVLVLIKNYGGDVLNFTGAAEVLRTESSTPVATVVVGDDVAFGADHDAQRGIAGTVLLYRILGAAAKEGASLADLVALAARSQRGLRSVGASLSSCTVPGSAAAAALPAGEYELGLGIHGEAGKERLPFATAARAVQEMLALIRCPPPAPEFAKPVFGDAAGEWALAGGRFVLFVNNLGATSDIEVAVVVREAVAQLRAAGASVERLVVGRAMTALTMHGVSLSLLRCDDRVAALLDSPASVIGSFAVAAPPTDEAVPEEPTVADRVAVALREAAGPSADPWCAAAVAAVCSALIDDEARLNGFDAIVGDGDIGSGAARAARSVSAAVQGHAGPGLNARCVRELGPLVADSFAGTSGPLCGAFLAAAAEAARGADTEQGRWAAALRAGVAAVQAVGSAAVGDRTMVDALEPMAAAAEALPPTATRPEIAAAVRAAAVAASAEARQLRARKGRARYSNGREVGEAEPGCEMVCVIAAALEACSSQ